MPNLTYIIHKGKENKKTGLVPVIASVDIENKSKWKTITWIKPEYWNPKPEQNKWLSAGRTGSDDHGRNLEVNQLLKNYRDRVQKYFDQCISEGRKITFDLVKTYLDGSDPKAAGKTDFWIAYQTYLDAGLHKSGTKEPSTRKDDKTTRNLLQKFETETGYKMEFDRVNLTFDDKLRNWMFRDIPEKDIKPKRWNYYCAQIKRLKTFMNWSLSRGYHSERDFKLIKAKERPITIIYLNENELRLLFNFQYENPKHSRARDLFCFACFTGLRYSDLNRLTRDHWQGEYIIIYPYKVKEKKDPLHVPLSNPAKTILNRYLETWKLLPKLSGQKLNKVIKEAAKIAGINTPTSYKDHIGGTTQFFTDPKHELISSHTGRKTFVCLSHAKGMDIETIMKITGMTYPTVKHYLTVEDETTRQAVNDVFNGM